MTKHPHRLDALDVVVLVALAVCFLTGFLFGAQIRTLRQEAACQGRQGGVMFSSNHA